MPRLVINTTASRAKLVTMTNSDHPTDALPIPAVSPQPAAANNKEENSLAPVKHKTTHASQKSSSLPASSRSSTKVEGSFAASTWAALIVGSVLLIGLIIFILQNQQTAELNFFQWTWHLPAGIAFLLFSIAGALIMALVGGWRMFELRHQLRKARKALRAQ